MRILETFNLVIQNNGKEIRYFYRLTESNTAIGQAFGIEVEKQDIKNGILVNIDRDAVEVVSNKEEKVRNLLNLLYKNNVSPLHLIDIIGEYVDEYVCDFEEVVLV